MLSIQERVDLLTKIMADSALMPYIGESVSQLDHALQCAKFATDSGADEEVILAALFHDLGHLVSHPALCWSKNIELMDGLGTADHEKIGSYLLRKFGFSDKICDLVYNHVEAKRYLVWKCEQYANKLSSASKLTLQKQGGPMNDQEAKEFENNDNFQEILKLRTWDDKAKMSGVVAPSLEIYRLMMFRQLTTRKN